MEFIYHYCKAVLNLLRLNITQLPGTFGPWITGKSYIEYIFQLRINNRPIRSQHLYNLKVTQPNQTTFGTNSLTSLGAQIWNTLQPNLKSGDNLQQFKK